MSFTSFLPLSGVSIGVLNLLPAPMLDGGQLLYHLFEAIEERPFRSDAETLGQRVGIGFVPSPRSRSTTTFANHLVTRISRSILFSRAASLLAGSLPGNLGPVGRHRNATEPVPQYIPRRGACSVRIPAPYSTTSIIRLATVS